MDKIDFQEILNTHNKQFSRIENVKNTLHHLEEGMDKIMRQVSKELLKTKKGNNNSDDKWAFLFKDLVHDWQDGLNYFSHGGSTYQFHFNSNNCEIKDFKLIKITLFDKKEVSNAS